MTDVEEGTKEQATTPNKGSKIATIGLGVLALGFLGWAVAMTILYIDEKDKEVSGGSDLPTARKLMLVHSSDLESAFEDPNTLEDKLIYYTQVYNGFKILSEREKMAMINVQAGDFTLPSLYNLANSFVYGFNGAADIRIFNSLNTSGIGLGNHEFDNGIDTFSRMLEIADFPMLSVNLDFSNVQLAAGTPPILTGDDAMPCLENAGRIVKSCYLETDIGHVGLIGRSPADFFAVVENDGIPGLDFIGGSVDGFAVESAAPMVLEQVDLLTGKGVDIIVLLDHAQDYTNDPLAAEQLRGIDIIVTAGSTGFYASDAVLGPFNMLRDGDVADLSYPVTRLDSEGSNTLVVNTDQLYKYLAALMVTFDEEGKLVSFDGRSGPVACSEKGVAAFTAYLGEQIPEDATTRQIYNTLQGTEIIQDGLSPLGTTVVPLVGKRSEVRSRETNLGRIAADSSLWYASIYAADNSLPAVDVALKNGGGIRSDIVGEQITRVTIRTALAFDNKLAIVEVTGAQLIALMENGFSRACFTDGRYPHTAGIVAEYDVTKPGLESQTSVTTPSRVKFLSVNKSDGTTAVLVTDFVADPNELDSTFVVATNGFLVGGDGYVALEEGTTLATTAIGEQLILEEYIIDELGGVVDVQDPPVARITPATACPSDE